MLDQHTFKPVILRRQDVAEAAALSAEIHWNQSIADWDLMIGHGKGLGIRLDESPHSLVATAVVLPFGNEFAWISMVIVKEEWRRRGLSNYLLNECLKIIRNSKRTALLDATPAGEKVYGSLGFRPIGSLSRWLRKKNPVVQSNTRISVFASTDPNFICRFDQENSCLRREHILDWFYHSYKPLIFSSQKGFVLGRKGLLATQAGPLVAVDFNTAVSLFDQFVTAAGHEDVITDVYDDHTVFLDHLKKLGFIRQRTFKRMALGEKIPAFNIPNIYCIAGPEYG